MEQINSLSKREKEVIELLLQGKSNKLIALSLGISDRTVEFHLKNAYAKFQVNSRIELILKLGVATGGTIFKGLGTSTVDGTAKNSDNGNKSIPHYQRLKEKIMSQITSATAGIRLATIGFIFGLVSLAMTIWLIWNPVLLITGSGAIVGGMLSLNQIKGQGGNGKKVAIMGIVLGVLTVLWFVVLPPVSNYLVKLLNTQ